MKIKPFYTYTEAPTLNELKHAYNTYHEHVFKGSHNSLRMMKHLASCSITIAEIIILVKHCGVKAEDEIRYIYINGGRTFIINKNGNLR